MQMHVMIVLTPSQPEMTGRVEAEADPQKHINVSYVDATNDQPIPDIGDQSETDGFKGFLNLGFMPQAVVYIIPLNFVYP